MTVQRNLACCLSVLTLLFCCKAPAGWAAPTEKTGPIGPNTPPCRWGARVKDAVNDAWVWFGGVGGRSTEGGLGTWIYKDDAWKRAAFEASDAFKQVESLALEARTLYAAVANRHYASETQEARGVNLGKAYAKTAAALTQLAVTAPAAAPLKAEALERLTALAQGLSTAVTVEHVANARAAWMALVRLSWPLAPEPPFRSYPGMAFDAKTGKIVLFGGEGIHGTYNDTWIYDCAQGTWQRMEPKGAPSPRLAHGMLARDGHVYLAGGFQPRGSMSYMTGLWTRLPVDVWRYDIERNTWHLLKPGEEKPSHEHMQPAVRLSLSEDGKTLAWKGTITRYRKKKGEVTGSLQLPAPEGDTKATAQAPNAIKVRSQGFDPAWYETAPPPDRAAFQRFLEELPPNRWVRLNTPIKPVQRDWGTTVLDSDRDQLLFWAGGHSSHCGTDVAHFSLQTGRWHILYTPELPFEFCYSNSGAPVPTMSGHKPWADHTYLAYAYDSVTRTMIYAEKKSRFPVYNKVNPTGIWVYDPETYEWSAKPWTFEGGKFDPERHRICMASTPHGVLVWAPKRGGWSTGGPSGLWLARAAERVFKPVAGTDYKDGTTFPHSAYGDKHGLAYDSKRDRALMMHFGRKDKHRIWATDLKTKTVSVLTPKGSEQFPAALTMARECTYMPAWDMVLVPASGKGIQKTLLYDCTADQWLEMPLERTHYGVSSGLEWDAKRKLLWQVDAKGNVDVMRFERETAGLKAL